LDEIDSIIKVTFKDDFFALIRACYNQRAENPAYNRLTFCLLGVATPSELIQDKQCTPFNIGQGIQLTGFTVEEAKGPLVPGLVGKVDHPEQVLGEIVNWTGGQPFLTQRLCRLVVENAASGNSLSVEQVVRSQIIKNWEAQDEPEHLKTIRDRILRNEQRAGSRLLGLYQQVLDQGSLAADGSQEQTELRLSGLVVERQGCLKVNNRIYGEVFNPDWVNKELARLRPYSEAFTAWVDSGRTDDSRLLRGKALEEARDWARGKSLSDLDREFLDASQDLDKGEVQKALTDEKKNSQVLAKAQGKAKLTIRRGGIVLNLLLVVAIVAVVIGIKARQETEVAKSGAELEPQGRSILGKLPDDVYYGTSTESETLLYQAVETGQKLFNIVKDGRPLDQYPAISPLYALQQTISKFPEPAVFKGHQGLVSSVAFSLDGQKLATASFENIVRILDLQGNEITELKGHQDEVNDLEFSQDGQRLATASYDGTARIWDKKGNEIAVLTGHQGVVRSLEFSPDGQKLATASFDKTAIIWDLQGNQLAVLTGHQDELIDLEFSPNGKMLATTSWDNTARIWDLQGNEIALLKGHQGAVWSVAFSPNGKMLATASYDKTARIWDLQGNPLAVLKGHQGAVSSLAFSWDGKKVATASDDGTARIWDTKGNQLAVLTGHQGAVNDVELSQDGKKVATASDDGTVRIWDTKGNQLAELKGHQGAVNDVEFRPDEQRLATASGDGTAILWDLQSKELALLIQHQPLVLYSVAFSLDGQKLATASFDNTARIWNNKGNPLAVLKGHQALVSSVAFSPDRQRLATASFDNTARIWDNQGNPLAVLKGHQDNVTSIAFSPNGQRLATASWDKTARIWDNQGNPLAVLKGHQDNVTSIAFSPDGQRLARVVWIVSCQSAKKGHWANLSCQADHSRGTTPTSTSSPLISSSRDSNT
ncbi:MAG: hypothetical protein F6K56_33520, partial [Moorea sp. SIO3G5]|nr:hypothetical protein [Moorena sp. SIO3G5]